jgi:PAS domain S-box-containing protein
MSLRRKTLLLLLSAGAALTLVVATAVSAIIKHSFASLEAANTSRDVARVRGVLAAELAAIDRYASDWANWDDACVFVADHNRDFIEANLVPQTLPGLGLHVLALADTTGRVVVARTLEPDSTTGETLPADLAAMFVEGGALSTTRTAAGLIGIVRTASGPLLAAARPVRHSDRTGPSRGTLLMARRFDEEAVHELERTTHLSISLLPPDRPGLSELHPADPGAHDEAGASVRPVSRDTVAGYALLTDVESRPLSVLRVALYRSIYKQGLAVLAWVHFAVLLACLVLGGLMLVLLEKSVLGRLSRLTRDVVEIGREHDATRRVAATGRDELATLGREMNRTMGKLNQAQAEVRQSEERFRDLFDGTSDLIQAVTPEGRLLYTNRAWRETLGYTESDVSGLTMLDVIHPAHHDLCTRVFKDLLSGVEVGVVQTMFVAKGGRPVAVEGSVSCRFENGRPVHTRGMFRDVSQRVRLIAELKTANAELGRRNAELAESIRQRRELFDLAIAHDFGTPLTVIQSYLELVSDGLMGPVTDKQTKALATMAARLDELVKVRGSILEVSDFDAGKISLRKGQADIGALVATSLSEASTFAHDRGVELVSQVEPAGAVCDETRMKQAIDNVLVTALKYAGSGTRIAVAAARENGHVHFSATDVSCSLASGSGAAERFAAGIESALASAIITAHGGRLWTETSPDQPKGIHFTIPAS